MQEPGISIPAIL